MSANQVNSCQPPLKSELLLLARGIVRRANAQRTATVYGQLIFRARGAGAGRRLRGRWQPDSPTAAAARRQARAAAPVACRWRRSGGSGGIDGGPNIVQTCLPPAAIDQPAAKLSQTGCMDPTDTKKMAASVIPYEVNSPLWSDGADKQRGMALPNRRQDSRQELRDDAGRVPAGRGRRRQVGVARRHGDGEELPVRRQAGRDAPVRPLRCRDLGRLQLPVGRGADRRDHRRRRARRGSVQHRPAHGRLAHPEPHGLHDLPHADAAARRWVPRRRR